MAIGKMMHQYYSSLYKVTVGLVHEANAISTIQQAVSKLDTKLIIELGTDEGGFTIVLHEACPDVLIYSYDRLTRVSEHVKKALGKNVKLTQVDLLKGEIKEIINLLQLPEKKLLYCDNGNKIKEVQTYSRYLNTGDYLGIHDWGNEIKMSDVKTELFYFEPLPVNDIFILNKWTTRFFRRVG